MVEIFIKNIFELLHHDSCDRLYKSVIVFCFHRKGIQTWYRLGKNGRDEE